METCPVTPRILLADDQAEVRQYVAEVLGSCGAEVTAVPDGQSVIREAMGSPHDLCILDIDMPGMDGLETCRRLRAAPFTRSLPVLFLTGYADADTIDKAFAAGGSDYLAKPVHPTLLWLRVRNLLLLSGLKQERTRMEDVLKVLSSPTAQDGTPAP